MPKCPQCSKDLPVMTRQCRFCKADLDLLVEYVNHLDGGLERAEELTRAGELDRAIWTYLEVLEVDPGNATARKQVGRVATAVRQFDNVSPTRRWMAGVNGSGSALLGWLRLSLFCLVVVLAFGAGFLVGSGNATYQDDTGTNGHTPPVQKRDRDTLTGN